MKAPTDKTKLKSLANYIVDPVEFRIGMSYLFFFLIIITFVGGSILYAIFEKPKHEETSANIDSCTNVQFKLLDEAKTKTTSDSIKNNLSNLIIMARTAEKMRFESTMYHTVIPVSILSIFYVLFSIITYFEVRKKYFHCPHCYKAIYINKIVNMDCPACNKKNISFIKLVRGKCSCETKLKYVPCPHCQEEINLFKMYDHKKIKDKIHES